jgi:hypothetical protein
MRRSIARLALAAGLALAGPAARALAADIAVGVNESRLIGLNGSAATVTIGDPDIADVAMTDSHSLILVGRHFGSTRLLVTDHKGRPLLDSRVAVAEGDSGRVTFFRGITPSEFVCAGSRCHPTAAATAAAGPAAAPPAGDAPVGGSGPVGPVQGQPIQPSPGL